MRQILNEGSQHRKAFRNQALQLLSIKGIQADTTNIFEDTYFHPEYANV
jgi:hypothetical protein